MVKDITPGILAPILRHFVDVNGPLYFVADDFTTSGTELWKSDGTEAGTVRVKDIRPGFGDGNPQTLVSFNPVLSRRSSE